MADSILDRLDRDPGGAREYVATLLVSGATRAQVADAMARRFNITAPTGRSVTEWKNNDPELRDLIRRMEAAKRDLAAGDDPTNLLPRQPNPARVVGGLMGLAIQCRPFAELLKRDSARSDNAASAAAEDVGWYFDEEPLPGADPDAPPDDVLAVLLAGHETDAEFEADCRARLAAS